MERESSSQLLQEPAIRSSEPDESTLIQKELIFSYLYYRISEPNFVKNLSNENQFFICNR
jgi:hypothetical protein